MTNLSIRKVLLSPNHTIFAYQTEREGEEIGNLHFKDLSGVMDLKVSILLICFLLFPFDRVIDYRSFRVMFWKTSLITSGLMITKLCIILSPATNFDLTR
jgi:hypothetical protein